jgi:cold shock CspA family protein
MTAPDEPTLTGTVKFFKPERGYGFFLPMIDGNIFAIKRSLPTVTN